jgi:pimeloyl-ACP methyl ester carboxylesterase
VLPEVPGVSHRYVVSEGVRLHVAEAGQGAPVVLLHGWPQHWWMWRKLLEGLAEDYRVVCPDLRGFGWSGVPASGYGVRQLADDVLTVADEFGIDRFRVIGHDVGLGIGYWLCLFHTPRVERFVAMSAWHPWAASAPSLGMLARPWHMALLASPFGPAAVRRGMPAQALRRWRQRGRFSAEEVEIYTAPLQRQGADRATMQRYRSQLREIAWFTRRHLRLRLEVPTLHLVGEDDPIIEMRPTRKLETHTADFTYEEVPGCGHFPAEERPGWTLGRLGSFLRPTG